MSVGSKYPTQFFFGLMNKITDYMTAKLFYIESHVLNGFCTPDTACLVRSTCAKTNVLCSTEGFVTAKSTYIVNFLINLHLACERR